jgi:hypothetical protein
LNKKSNAIIIACTFLWLGFVLAISFMEAWLKFEAPDITVPLGLGIGRLVFTALNLVELSLIVLILGSIVFSNSFKDHKQYLFFYLAFFIVILQTVWMLPALDDRAVKVMADKHTGTSMLHLYYIVIEFMKVLLLFAFGIRRLLFQ